MGLSQPCPFASTCSADVERLAFSVIWEVTPDAEVRWGVQFETERFTARVGWVLSQPLLHGS